jgi:uncharacterized protein (TIGR02466 family)
MPIPPDAVALAYECFSNKRYPQAENICRELLTQFPNHATALHLLGLIRKESGDPLEGERLIRASIALEPQRAEFRANLGNLQRRQGQLEAAVASYRSALEVEAGHRPARLGLARTLKDLGLYSAVEGECRILLAANANDAESWCTLGGALRQQDRYVEAESAYRRALSIRPGYGVAHHNLGGLLSDLDRVEEALSEIEHAQRVAGVTCEGAISRGHALLKLGRLSEAEVAYGQAVQLSASDPDAHLSLAKLRFMRGDPEFARDLTAAAAAFPRATQLQFACSDLLRRAGDLPGAERCLHELLQRQGPSFEVHCALATLMREQGQLQAAEKQALRAVSQAPGNPTAVETLVAIQLSLGHADHAMSQIEQQRIRRPADQRWIAYWLTAARLRGDPLYRELCDYDALVQCFDIQPPAADWQSIAALNAAASKSLLQRHQFARHPLDQSLRNGSQTSRSLLSNPDAAIQSLLRAFQEPLHRYAQQIRRDGHSLLAHSGGDPVIRKCWSVLLGPGGFHVSHMHPEGWISSAYYVGVPDEVDDTAAMRGWLKFGEPPFAAPGCGAEHAVQPRAGRLVLFPSFMWHGTNPILGTAPRLTIAFDAVAT